MRKVTDMSKGKQHLELVTKKLNMKIAELGEIIQEVQKDIDNMNEYYWENYTEMDEYGYENFDNQQALLTQVNVNEANRVKLHRMKKMLGAPFFGSVEFLFDGDDEGEEFHPDARSQRKRKAYSASFNADVDQLRPYGNEDECDSVQCDIRSPLLQHQCLMGS